MASMIRRFEQLKQQRAYERDVQARGLKALLAPYTGRLVPAPPAEEPKIPTQQRRVVVSVAVTA